MVILFHFYRLLPLFLPSLIFVGIPFFLLPAISHAQITLDGSLGPKGSLTGPNYAIDAKVGQQRGNNLFHSFGQFNVQTGESATFTGPSTVENVIGRVTGGQQSFIDGQLRSEMPQANLYLLNPSGVLFGPNATLDVPGSFHVSTADYLKLGDNGRFDATTPSNSVLTSAPPSAFGFLGGNPAGISIQGSSLEVPEGKTLSVVGGDIEIVGGTPLPGDIPEFLSHEFPKTLGASSGRINLASVTSPGEVIPNSEGQTPALKVDTFEQLGEIKLAQAILETGGNGAGTVVIRGGRLEVDNSSITSTTLGDVDGAPLGIDIRVTDDMALRHNSVIATESIGGGRAGDFLVEAGRLTVGGLLGSLSFGPGRAGDVTVTATDQILMANKDHKQPIPGGIGSTAATTGDAGRVIVSAPVLIMDDDEGLVGFTDTGRAGDIVVDVGSLTIKGGAFIGAGHASAYQGSTVMVTATDSISISHEGDSGSNASGLFNGTRGTGNAGRIIISTPTLILEEGGSIAAETFGAGRAGDIVVKVESLTLTGGAVITSTTYGAGQGGTITITATDAVSLSGRSSFNESLIASGTLSSGDAGRIVLSAPTLTMDGAAIGTSSLGDGHAGDVVVQVGSLTLTGGAVITSNTISAGQGGTVTVTATDSVSISGRASTVILLPGPSGLLANARGSGRGGDIILRAKDVRLIDGAEISAESTGPGSAGNIHFVATNTFRSEHGAVTTAATQAGGGKIDLSAGQIVELVDSQVTTTVQGGAGDAGNITIDPRYVILNDSQVIARAVEGNGGNIDIGADVFIASPTSVVSASSEKGISGTIDIRGVVNNLAGSIAPLPQGYLSTAALVEDRCAGRLREGQISSFVVTGLEGMPLQPGGVLPSPLYEAGQVRAQGEPGRNDHDTSFDFGATRLRSGRTELQEWQVPMIAPISLSGGCER